jgi:type II secretory pathway pseudopilin PulG
MLIEVLVAALMIAIAASGLLVALNGARSEGSYSELLNTGAAVADKEIQRITALKWSEMSLNAAASWTAKSSSTTDPSSYLSAGPCDESVSLPQYKPCYAYDWIHTAVTEPLVTATTGYDSTEDPYSFTTVAPGGSTRISGSVYRYITWVNDPKCVGTKNTCGGSNADKRITVAVTVSGLRKPIVLGTLYTNPEGNALNPLVDGAKCLDGGVEVSCTH